MTHPYPPARHLLAGPLQDSPPHFDVIEAVCESRVAALARISTRAPGRCRPGRPCRRGGSFVAPDIVADAMEGMRVVGDESFGPVSPVRVFDDEADSIRRANDAPFGLRSSGWTADPDRAQAVALQLGSGTTGINSHRGVEPGVQGLRGSRAPHVITAPARG